MGKTLFAWTRAFPTLFLPRCVLIEGKWRWATPHDISRWFKLQDSQLHFNDWTRYQMWRTATHPTFSIAVQNHKVKNLDQQQGRQAIRTSEMDPVTSMEAIRTAPTNLALARTTKDLVNLTHYHAANIPGSQA